jgi:hypothetical protein
VNQSNRRNAKTIDEERNFLLPLPKTRAIDYTERRVVVSSSSTIVVRRVTYTVPSRLQGECLNVKIYDDQLVCYLGAQHVVTLQRLHLSKSKDHGRQVDYRHVIHSLVKKPKAFRYSQLRNELLPDTNYRAIWKIVDQTMPPDKACKFIVGLLHLAATYACEKPLGERVIRALSAGQQIYLEDLQKQFCKKVNSLCPDVEIVQHGLEQYNQLIPHYSYGDRHV